MSLLDDIRGMVARRAETQALINSGEDPDVASAITDPANQACYHHLEDMPWPEIEEGLQDKWWRLNNLYYIIDKQGRKVLFRPNKSQRKLWNSIWYRTLILKARQRGFTSFIDLYLLDQALFEPNTECGVIAHNLDDAKKIFRRKIKFPYDCLPGSIREKIPLAKSSESELVFGNGSSIAVSVSLRSATAQFLHVSEFGKICAKYPEKAREIVTGALEAVAMGQFVFIESTAEGRSGYFYDYCKAAQDLQKMGKTLSPLDFRFFFSPWWEDPDYTMRPEHYAPITTDHAKYFEELEAKIGRKLSMGQKSWWVKKFSVLGEDMKREYPATPGEAFLVSIQGAYWADQLSAARIARRIGKVPLVPGIAVDTWWDLGHNDLMAIWFTQDVGREIHVIDYLESNMAGFEYFARLLSERPSGSKPDARYVYGQHWAPHDISVYELGPSAIRWESALKVGIRFNRVPRVKDKQDSIQAVRNIFPLCWFDEERCDRGITHLENYRREWDEHLGTYRRNPLHNEASNAADAFQCLAMGHARHLEVKTGATGANAAPVPAKPYAWS